MYILLPAIGLYSLLKMNKKRMSSELLKENSVVLQKYLLQFGGLLGIHYSSVVLLSNADMCRLDTTF